ncbi:histidine phosphatase family protein [Nakamurella sp.]|uniref:histidine phosphatase family protein n=1 Tax=Nakamurella sp. TaxID=1869182 RepID=UPI0037834ECF
MGVLLLVRHGQASFGSTDYDRLSPLGRRQADLLARRLAAGPDRIRGLVSGRLDRQRGTAVAIGAAAGVPTTVDGRWDEYDHVGITGGRSADLVFDPGGTPDARDRASATLDEALRRWIGGEPAGPETHPQFVQRCSAALRSVTASPGITVVSTSGGVIAVVAAMLLGLPIDRWPSLARVTVNCGFTKVIAGRRGLSVVSFNDHAHLEHDRALITYR